MLAHYYLGKVHFHNNNSQQATFEALRSISIARKLNEKDYIGRGYDLAADIAHYNYNSDKSIDYRKEAIKYFHANERQKRSELFANLELALAYENKHEYLISINILDSLRRIIEPKDSVLQALIVRALISPYYYSGNLDEAQLCYERLVNEYSSVVPPSSSDYIIREKIALHKNDGYSTFSPDFIDSVVPDSINPSKMYFLAHVYEKSGRYTESIKEFKKIVEFQDSVIANISKNSIDLGERDYFKAESDYYKLSAERHKLLTALSIVTVCIILLIILWIISSRIKSLKHQKARIENVLQSVKEKSGINIREKEAIIEELKSKLDITSDNKQLLEIKIHSLQLELEKLKNIYAINERIIENSDRLINDNDIINRLQSPSYAGAKTSKPLNLEEWEVVEDLINTTYPHFIKTIRVFGNISTDQLHMSMLLRMKIPYKTIALAMGRTPQAITMMHQRLFKKYLSSQDDFESWEDFVHRI